MALPEVTYDFYTETYLGELGEDAFRACLPHALSALQTLLGLNEPEGEAQELACRRAACAAVDADHAHGCSGGVGEGAGSLSVGSFSVGSGGASGASASPWWDDVSRAMRGELVGTGLLCQVIL